MFTAFKKKDRFAIGKADTIRDTAVKHLAEIIEDYSLWYEEHGIHLPPEYAHDPTGWTNDLQKVREAFLLLEDEDEEAIKAKEKEIVEGLTIFGKQLFYLTDPKNGTVKGQ